MYKVEKVTITNTPDRFGNWLGDTQFELLPKKFHSYENACIYVAKLAEDDAKLHHATLEQHTEDEYRTTVLTDSWVTRLVIFKVL